MTNKFHNATITFQPSNEGTISASTYRRAMKTLCPWRDCQCDTPLTLMYATEIRERGNSGKIIAYKIGSESLVDLRTIPQGLGE